jgi:hypothetical protein
MKYNKRKLLIGTIILALGIIIAIPAIADQEDDIPHMPQLYYYDEETMEYVPWYPHRSDPENPETFTPPEDCPWWDSNGDGEFDWMPHWRNRWKDQEGDSEEYGWRRSRCGGYGHRLNRGYKSG